MSVVLLCVDNSHDEWREASQANKAILSAAAKAFKPEAKTLVLHILNEDGPEEIEAIRNTKLGRVCVALLDRKRRNEPLKSDRDVVLDFASAGLGGTAGPSSDEEQGSPASNDSVSDALHRRSQPGPPTSQRPSQPATSPPHAGREFLGLPGAGDPDALQAAIQRNAAALQNRPPASDSDVLADLHDDEQAEGGDRDGEGVYSLDGPCDSPLPVYGLDGSADMPAGEEEKPPDSPSSSQPDDYVKDPDHMDDEDIANEEDEDDDENIANEEDWDDDGNEEVPDDYDIVVPSDKPAAAETVPIYADIWELLNSETDGEFNVTQLTKNWKKLWRESLSDSAKLRFDRNVIYTLYIFTLDVNRTYTEQDLENESDLCFERALRLLNRKRFGQEETDLRIVPYINYEALGPEEADAIRSAIERENEGSYLDSIQTAQSLWSKRGYLRAFVSLLLRSPNPLISLTTFIDQRSRKTGKRSR